MTKQTEPRSILKLVKKCTQEQKHLSIKIELLDKKKGGGGHLTTPFAPLDKTLLTETKAKKLTLEF